MSMSWLPNALTLLRCFLAFAVAGAVLQGAALSHELNAAFREWLAAGSPSPGDPDYSVIIADFEPDDLLVWPAIALWAFVLAALTDLFDGMAARALDARTAFGAVLMLNVPLVCQPCRQPGTAAAQRGMLTVSGLVSLCRITFCSVSLEKMVRINVTNFGWEGK